MGYPTRRNGDQYYPREEYLRNESGDEIYARDRKGNEFYPRRPKRLARDRHGIEYYARDCEGNDVYLLRRNRSVVMRDGAGEPTLAKTSTGRLRYPRDRRGNEYYPLRAGEPLLMVDEYGTPCYARNRAGREMVPRKILESTTSEEERRQNWKRTRDVARNEVYVWCDDDDGKCFSLWKCTCELLLLTPVVLLLGLYLTIFGLSL